MRAYKFVREYLCVPITVSQPNQLFLFHQISHSDSHSTSIWYLCSRFYLLIHCKIEFTPQWHPTFNRSHNNGFWPFLAIFAILARIEGAMRSYCASSRPPDMESRSFLVERLCYTSFYAAELLRNGA